jgi:hypothetical protein
MSDMGDAERDGTRGVQRGRTRSALGERDG